MGNNYLKLGIVSFVSVFYFNSCSSSSSMYSSNNQDASIAKMKKVSSENKLSSKEMEEYEKYSEKKNEGKKLSEREQEEFEKLEKKATNGGTFAFNSVKSDSELAREILRSKMVAGDPISEANYAKAEGEDEDEDDEKAGIEEVFDYYDMITKPVGQKTGGYKVGYMMKEFDKAMQSPFLAEAKAQANRRSGFKTAATGSTYDINNVVFTERGPSNVPGRTRTLAIPSESPDTWFIGTAGGGVWKTMDAGKTWSNTMDNSVPNTATSNVVVSKSNTNVLYAGTGEPFSNADAVKGIGMLKSSDGGKTWVYLNNTLVFGDIGRIAVDPNNENHVIVGTTTGIYVTNDGGVTWKLSYTGGSPSGSTAVYKNAQDLAYSSDFSAIYASIGYVGVVKSIDGGNTWALVFDIGLQKDLNGNPIALRRIELDVSPVDNNRVILGCYSNTATSNVTGGANTTTFLYKSDDAGATFSPLNFSSGYTNDILASQGWYDNVMTCSPLDKNVFYAAGVAVGKFTINPTDNSYTMTTIASGYNNDQINNYYTGKSKVHPDQHSVTYQVSQTDPAKYRLIITNDGGVYYTDYKTNPGETDGDWTGIAGVNSTQPYGADKKKGEDSYVEGAQDNGCWVTVTSPSTAASPYKYLTGGDGFQVLWNYRDTNQLLVGSQYNNFSKFSGGINSSGKSATFADSGQNKSPFISKLNNANNNPDVVFSQGISGIWRSTNFGTSWVLSPITTAANPGSGWTSYWSSAQVSTSVANPNIVYTGTVIGSSTGYRIQISRDNGKTFNPVTGGLPSTLAGNWYISGLDASMVNEGTLYVSNSTAGKPKIYKTADYGNTWSDITGFGANATSNNGFPNVSTFSVIEMPFDNNVIWAGTDLGLFETTDGGTSWHILTGLPAVSVYKMKIVDDQVVIATHGRGVWTATIPQLKNYVLPHYTISPVVTSGNQTGLHAMTGTGTFQYTDTGITSLKVYVDNVYSGTISNTQANTNYTYVTPSTLAEGKHTFSVSGLYNNNSSETLVSAPVSFDVINFNSGAQNVNLPSINAGDVYIASDGKFVVDNVGGKFAYNVLNDKDHPYLNLTNYQSYLRTPVVVGASSVMDINQMVFTEKGYDFAVVEASNDLVNWTTLGSYDESTFSDWNNINTATQVKESMWHVNTVDLTQKFSAGDEVAIRFRLTSDPGTVRYGWLIKSVTPSSTLGTQNLATNETLRIAPNPVGNEATLYVPSSVKGSLNISTYDAAGRVVNTQVKQAEPQVVLNFSSLTPGVYLLIIKGDNGFNRNLKIIKH